MIKSAYSMDIVKEINNKINKNQLKREILLQGDVGIKFKKGDKVIHYKYGEGVILGNYHKRPDGHYYWHIRYDNGTFGYNRESSLKSIE